MQRTIFVVLFLLAVCFTALGQVQLTNLDQKSFIIDVTGQPTNVVNLHLRNTQFSPSTTGWVLTNISGVYGGSTNIITNSIWGIDGFGNITPVVTNNAVIATNIVRYGVGRMFGTESWLSKAITLTNGPNYLGAAENSQFFLIGPTTNPADCQIILSNAVATGQKLVLVNQTNAIPAEGAWTMTNNTPIPDGAGVVKLLGGYDLVSTNGYISYFEFISPDWQEVGRILASGASGLLTNVFNNIVVYSNITLRGNSTLTINNITISTNDLWHTNLVGGVATLQPVNLGLQPMIVKGLTVGTNTTSSALLPAALANNVLSSVGNTDAGDPVERYIYIAQATSNGNPRSWLKSVVLTNSNSFQLGGNDGTSQVTFDILELGGNDFQFLVQTNAATILNIHPTATDGNVAYTLDTDRTHTIGHILDINNNQTNLWSFGVVSSGHIPEFAMFPPENNFSSIRSTNGINFNIDGASAYQWRINGLGFEPEFDGSTLASTLHPINGGHFNSIVWGDGGAGVSDTSGNGSPNGVSTAAVGSTWRDTNGTPGAVFYVKETGVGNTGWTAIGGGGSGGTNSLWFSYTLNGTTASLYDTNSFFGATIVSGNGVFGASGAFQSGLLTNSTDFIGIGQTAGRDLTASGNSSVTAIGESALRLGTLKNDFYIMAIGNGALDNAVVTNSLDVTAIGNNALHNATVYTSHDIIAEGLDALYGSTIKNSAQITAIANNSLYGAVLTNAVSVMGLNGALNAINMTNAYNISGLGLHAGFNVTGNQTNMVYLGESAFAPSGSINQVVIGPGMSLVMGTNTISTNGASPSLPLWNGATWPGGGGGTTLWYPYTVIDGEGGTVTFAGSTNSFQTNIVTFGSSFATNALNDYSAYVAIGYPALNIASLSVGNQNMFGFGTYAGWNMVATNAEAIFLYDDNCGTSMNLNNVFDMVNRGDNAGSWSRSTNSHHLYNDGHYSGWDATNTSSYDIYNYFDRAGYQATFTNTHDVFNMGGLSNAVLNASERVSALGLGAGNGINGSFTNVVLIGTGSTAASGTANQVILGTSMSLTAPGGLSSTATDAAIAITTTGITNNLGKLAFAYLQGTNLVFTIKDSSNTPYFTNSVAIGIQALPVQAGGAITISSGTASGVLKAL